MKVLIPYLILCCIGMSTFLFVYTMYIKTFGYGWLSALIILTIYMLFHFWQYADVRSKEMGDI